MTYPNSAMEAVREALAEWDLAPEQIAALAADLPGEIEAKADAETQDEQVAA